MKNNRASSINELKEIVRNITPVNNDEVKYRLYCLNRLINYKGSAFNLKEIFDDENIIHWLKTYYV